MTPYDNQIKIALLDNLSDEEHRLVYGVVASANLISSAGHFFSKKDLVDLSISFMKNLQSGNAFFDTHHQYDPINAYVVESFITESPDKNTTNYPSDSWVIGIKVEDDDVWGQVKTKSINSFSASFMASMVDEEVEYETPTVITGVTEVEHGHHHTYVAMFDEDGNIIAGKTSEVDGHFHELNSIGSTGKGADHVHRFYTSY